MEYSNKEQNGMYVITIQEPEFDESMIKIFQWASDNKFNLGIFRQSIANNNMTVWEDRDIWQIIFANEVDATAFILRWL